MGTLRTSNPGQSGLNDCSGWGMGKTEDRSGEVYTKEVTFDLEALEYAKDFNLRREGRHSRQTAD